MKDIVSDFHTLVRFIENKDHLIDKLDLTDDQKNELKDFFKKHPNFESKIDWNNKSLQYKDFLKVLKLEGNTKSSQKKYGLSGKAQIEDLIEGKDYEIILEDDDKVLYFVKTFKASEVLAKPTTAPEGITGKWCIAGKNYSPGTQDQHWKKYTRDKVQFFFYFDKKDPAKFAYAIKYLSPGDPRNNVNVFDQNDMAINALNNQTGTRHELAKINDIIQQTLQAKWDKLVAEADSTLTDLLKNLANGKEYQWFVHRDDLYNDGSWVFTLWHSGVAGAHPLFVGTRNEENLTEFKSLLTDLKIPATIKLGPEDTAQTVPVTIVAQNACNSYSNLRKVTLPRSIRQIGQYAFYDCKSLKSINLTGLPNLYEIEAYAFHNTALKTVEFKKPVKFSMGVFEGCKDLTTVILPWHIYLDISLSSGISRGMFQGCTSLQSIILDDASLNAEEENRYKSYIQSHNSRAAVESWAFLNCTSLETVNLPYGISHTENNAFAGCTKLRQLTVPGTFKSFNASFENVPALTVTIKGPKRHIDGLGLLPEGSKVIWEKDK